MKFDSDRMTWLRALGAVNGVCLTPFEESFVKSALRFQTTSPAFSAKQRDVVEEMFKKYGHLVTVPVESYRVPQNPKS